MNYPVLKIFLRIVIYGLSIYLLFSLYFLYVYIHPSRFISDFTPKDLGLEYEDVALLTKDGIKLAAWFMPQKNSNKSHSPSDAILDLKEGRGKAIIVCHGYPADKGNILSLASFLVPHYNILLFDFRAMGKSQGRFTTGGWKEREDFLAAIRFLKERGFKDIGALGFSMGAAVILMSESIDIKAIVSDSSYASLDSVLNLIFQNFGPLRFPFVWSMKFLAKFLLRMDVDEVSPLKYITRIDVPIFLIHSQQDSQIPKQHAQLLHQANPKNNLWMIPAGDHGEGSALMQEEYQGKVLKFFQANL